MRDLHTAPPGYASVVHQGPLEPVTLFKAPHTFVLYSTMLCMVISTYVTLRWLYIYVLLHAVAALVTWIDPHLLAILWQRLRYRRVYRP